MKVTWNGSDEGSSTKSRLWPRMDADLEERCSYTRKIHQLLLYTLGNGLSDRGAELILAMLALLRERCSSF